MRKQCQNCRKNVSDDAFICPHCGAILGQSVQRAKPIPKPKKPKNTSKEIKLPSLPWLGPVLMILLVLVLALALPRYLNGNPSAPETTVTTEPTTSTAPLVTYHVQVKGGQRVTLEHVLVEVYRDDTIVATGVTGINGRTSFTIPESDEYRLRLLGLPIQFDANYCDSWFTFDEGQQELVITLENKPIPYVVKVVNQEGEPIQGASLSFMANSDRTPGITNKNGICSFEALYEQVGYWVRIKSLPNGYDWDDIAYFFNEDSTELVIVVRRIEESIPDGMVLYTVRVVDEYGMSVPETWIYALYAGINNPEDDSYGICEDGYTNLDGYFTFIGDPGQTYAISLPELPDYSEELFYFDDGSRELLIQLDLVREAYTYTVYIVDQYGEPYPDVELFLLNTPGPEDIRYVSDENGVITFNCSESDPTKVVLYRTDFSAGMQGKYVYTFDYFTRKQEIKIVNPDKDIIYQVTVQDQNGQPVVGATLMLADSMGQAYYATSNRYGLCVFVLRSVGDCMVQIQYLPEGYSGDLFAPRFFSTGSREMTWIVVTETEPAE